MSEILRKLLCVSVLISSRMVNPCEHYRLGSIGAENSKFRNVCPPEMGPSHKDASRKVLDSEMR